MSKQFFRVITIIAFILTGLGISALVLFPRDTLSSSQNREYRQSRIITPRQFPEDPRGEDDYADFDEGIMTKAALDDGETLVSLLTDNFDEDPEEEQIIAYRNLREKDGAIYITYVDFDPETQEHRRIWTSPTLASRPGTVSLSIQDLLGDRTPCVILEGMNQKDEHTLTVFRKTPAPPFTKIAELGVNGTITIQEVPRTPAYQQGYAAGEPFALAVRSPAETAPNTLDQQERTYTYNETSGRYEQSNLAYIPGKQIDQYRLQNLLGNVKVFEGFIDGLWYYMSPQGTLDTHQYIYFDPQRKELIFFGDESQQVFNWQRSSVTRYGISIVSQNISVTTLRRSVDIELESMDSIRVRVSENIRLRIGVNASWDGSYQKAKALPSPGKTPSVPSYLNAEYSGSIGKIQFFPDGAYTVSLEGLNRRGKYAFFSLNDQELLEFRPEPGSPGASRSLRAQSRELYLVEHAKNEASDSQEAGKRENLTLLPVRMGTQGIQKLHQTAVFLVRYDPLEEKEGPPPALMAESSSGITEGLPVPVLSFSSQPEYFSPDNDGENDELTMLLGAQSASPIVSWSLEIREPQPPYLVFYHIDGKGSPPGRILWNGRSNKGELVQAATDYPFTFKAEDSQGGIGSLNGVIGVDVLIIREGNGGLRIQVPSIIFRAGYADFEGLPQETVDNNNRVLRRIAEILNKFRNYQVRIEGHANRTQEGDKLEEEETTELQPLSESRARTVVNYLSQFGVNRNRLTSVGMGSTRPVANFEDRDNWWKNRRVEFILLK